MQSTVQIHIDDVALHAKYEQLCRIFRTGGRAVVAFSGGVDSALVAVIAHDVLGHDMLAVTAHSPAYPESDWRDAQAIVEQCEIPHRVVETHEIDAPGYQQNASNRCYFCKSELFTVLSELAQREGFSVVYDGTNASDQGDHRPGRQAAREHGVRSPLAEANLSKDEVRQISRARGLPTWDKPAMACLASRFAYGEHISPQRLAQVAHCERLLYDIGCRQVRVRHHGEVARIEVGLDELDRVLAHRAQIVQEFRRAGFVYVTLDLQGFRSGSMNEALGG